MLIIAKIIHPNIKLFVLPEITKNKRKKIQFAKNQKKKNGFGDDNQIKIQLCF